MDPHTLFLPLLSSLLFAVGCVFEAEPPELPAEQPYSEDEPELPPPPAPSALGNESPADWLRIAQRGRLAEDGDWLVHREAIVGEDEPLCALRFDLDVEPSEPCGACEIAWLLTPQLTEGDETGCRFADRPRDGEPLRLALSEGRVLREIEGIAWRLWGSGSQEGATVHLGWTTQVGIEVSP